MKASRFQKLTRDERLKFVQTFQLAEALLDRFEAHRAQGSDAKLRTLSEFVETFLREAEGRRADSQAR